MVDVQMMLFDFDKGTKPAKASSKPQEKPKRRGRMKKEVFDLMDALCSPVITYPSPWNIDLPEDIFGHIQIAQLKALSKKEQTATIPEVVAYLYSASMEGPLYSEWANVYLWVCGEYLKKYRSMDLKGVDFIPESLSDYEQSELNRLRDFIYRKRREALKKKIRSLEGVRKARK